MIQKLKLTSLFVGLSLLAVVSVGGVLPQSAHAQDIEKNVKCGANFNLDGKGSCATTKAGCDAGPKNDGETDAQKDARCAALGDPSTNLENLITKIVNVLSVVVGVVAVIMIIIGGFKYITSGGDSNKVASAKNTIIYAIVGLIVAALAQVITRFVLSQIT